MSEEAQNLLFDTMVLLGQTKFNLSVRRRYLIRPFSKKTYSSLCNIATPVTNRLFGDDLNKEIKNCDTSISIARDQSTPFRGFRGHDRGHARVGALLSEVTDITLTFLGSMVVVVSVGTILIIQFSQLQQFQQLQAPKRGSKSATVTSQNDIVA